MTERPLIRCPGCQTVVAPTRAVCPGCGACLACGRRRSKKLEECPKCSLPYCDCCGRCPKCLELRYSDVGPCDCGHPNDESKIESLARYEAVVGAEIRPTPFGCVVAILAFFAVLILSSIGVAVWLL